MKSKLVIRIVYVILFMFGTVFNNNSNAIEPVAKPTFHCMSLYWSPTGGIAAKKVQVSYKKTSDSKWMQGLAMRYNPISGTTLDKADYRGSVVNLTPATSYDFKLKLDGTTDSAMVTMSTWDENFPVESTVNVESQSTTLKITKGGSEGKYIVYDGRNNEINVNHKLQNCIKISASRVIVRNFILKGAGTGTGSWPPIGAIQIDDGVEDVIIEGCDISDFGRPHQNPIIPNQGYDRDCGIHFANGTGIKIERVVIQRNKIHHPTYTTNNSFQNGGDTYTHPEGPQGITMYNNRGNHVIRYNEIYSDLDHKYNDIISGSDNGSYEGVPGPDTDIYNNLLSHCWDNAVELEGGGQNVRCWNNYMTIATDVIGNAAVSIGPFYLFRNVVDKAEWTPGGEAGRFIKMGHAGNENFMTGHMYIFNNTTFQTDGKGVGEGIGGGDRITKHCVSRNNIIQLRTTAKQSISQSSSNIDNDFNYDLYNGTVPTGSEKKGLKKAPVYVQGAGFNSATNTGNFQLATTSPGYNVGEIIPNFTDGFKGTAPDMGAHENGWPDFQYGVNAVFDNNLSTAIHYSPSILPGNFTLHQNTPNPFNLSTKIEYDLTKAASVQLDIYGLQGNLINRLVDARQTPGKYSVLWDASDGNKTKVPVGPYFYKINVSEQGNSFSDIRKMLYVR